MFRLSFDCIMDCVDMCHLKLFSPHHLVHYAHITLNDLHNLCGDIFIRIVRNGGAVVAVFNKFYCRIDGLEKSFSVDAGENESRLVERLGTFGRGTDANCRKRMSYAGEERTLLGKGARIGNDSECVHLKAIVVVEPEWLLDLYSRIKFETCSLKAVTAPGMATVENRHVILLGHCVYRIEKAEEVLLRVDVLFAVSTQQDVVPLLESESLVYIGCLDLGKVLMEHLGHGRTGDVCTLTGKSAFSKVSSCMLGVGEIDVRDDVHDTAVRLLRKAFVFAAVAGLHVENRNVEPFCPDDTQTAVGVAKNEYGIRFGCSEKLVAAVDDVAAGRAEVISDCIHVDFRFGEFQVAEEDAVKVIVVVLSGMGQNHIEIFAAFGDDSSKPDDLRAGADDDEQFQLTVVFKGNAAVVRHTFLLSSYYVQGM